MAWRLPAGGFRPHKWAELWPRYFECSVCRIKAHRSKPGTPAAGFCKGVLYIRPAGTKKRK